MTKKLSGHMALWVAAKKMSCKTLERKLLILYYCGNANTKGYFFKSYVDATLETGISERTIRRLNREWEKVGLLRTIEPDIGSGKATEYFLSISEIIKLSESSSKKVDRAKELERVKSRERIRRWREQHSEGRKPLKKILRESLLGNV